GREAPDDRQRGVARDVPRTHEGARVAEAEVVDRVVRAAGPALVRMPRRKEGAVDEAIATAPRSIEVRVELALHDLALAIEHRVVHALERIREALALDPQRELEAPGRHRLVEGRGVFRGAGVHVPRARRLEQLRGAPAREVARPVEDEVLDE